MTIDQALAFAVIAGMMAMFVWNRLRYDLVALLGLLIAVACGIVPVDEAFAGFSDPCRHYRRLGVGHQRRGRKVQTLSDASSGGFNRT